MEVAYRYLIDKLQNNPLVRRVKWDYWSIHVSWLDGTRERLAIPRQLNKSYYYRSPYRIRWLPYAKWPEEISNDREIKPIYLYGFNPIENDQRNLAWSLSYRWEDYQSLGQLEKIIFPHQLINQLRSDCDLSCVEYPEHILAHSLNEAISSQRRDLDSKLGFVLSRSSFDPARIFLEHFIPIQFFGRNQIARIFRGRVKLINSYLLKGIYRIISANIKLIKRGRKKSFYNFDLRTILRMISRSKLRLQNYALIRPIQFYREVFDHYNLINKNVLDLDPRFGEKYLAAMISGLNYHYVPVSPFDTSVGNMVNFTKYPAYQYQSDKIYDVCLADLDFKCNLDQINEILLNYSNYKEMLLFVSEPNRQLVVDLIKTKSKIYTRSTNRTVKVSRNPNHNGYWFHIINQN